MDRQATQINGRRHFMELKQDPRCACESRRPRREAPLGATGGSLLTSLLCCVFISSLFGLQGAAGPTLCTLGGRPRSSRAVPSPRGRESDACLLRACALACPLPRRYM